MYIRLVPGYQRWQQPFQKQRQALSNVIHAIFLQLGLEAPSSTETPPATIVFNRRLLLGAARFPEVAVMGRRGELEDAVEGELDAGDLVDITAWFDIAVVQGNDGLPRTSVFMAFDRVVRLRTQMELEFLVSFFFFLSSFLVPNLMTFRIIWDCSYLPT